MGRWIIAACLLALAAGPVAAADVRLGPYRHPESERMHIFTLAYLDGVKAGLMAYNAWLKSHGKQQAFCMPEDLALTTERVEDIMLKSAEKRTASDDTMIAVLLLSGMRDTFPCENAFAP